MRKSSFSLVALATALALGGAAAAQDQVMLGILAGQAEGATGIPLVMAASAACLFGAGDGMAVATILGEAGWTVFVDAEMGMAELSRDGADVYVSLYDDGRICDVASESIGTSDAGGALQTLFASTGASAAPMTGSLGCEGYEVGAAQVEITSTGQDPACQSDSTSTLRFTFGDAQ